MFLFVVSHIYIENNSCADSLANLGLIITHLVHFDSLPLDLRIDFVKNKLDLFPT